MAGDVKAVLRLVWLGSALACGAAVLAPFFIPAPLIARVVPQCESKRLYGRPCWMCGTTTGFIAISNGEWREARRSNALAVPLFAALSVNATAAVAYLLRRALR